MKHLWTVAYLDMLLCFPSKISFNWLFWFFIFYLFPPFYFLKRNRFFSTSIPVPHESRNYFNYILSGEGCTKLQIKKFPVMKLSYTIWIYGGSEFQNNYQKAPISHLFFLKLLELKFIYNYANNNNLALIIAQRFTKKSQNSISLFLNMTPWNWQIKILPLW